MPTLGEQVDELESYNAELIRAAKLARDAIRPIRVLVFVHGFISEGAELDKALKALVEAVGDET